MKLEDIDIYKLLPTFMKKDKFDSLFAQGMNNLFQELAAGMQRTIIIGQIDNLREDELDQLANDMNIFWYSKTVSLEIKRKLIKNAPLVFRRLGTVWAVESVLNDYLPGSELAEWFDYNGEPHHFKIFVENIESLNTDIDVFLNLLDRIKRKSQWLDSLIIHLQCKYDIHISVGMAEGIDTTFNCTESL